MGTYLFIALIVFVVNVIPAFAPPTWAVLVLFTLHNHVNAVVVIALGVICATLGRLLLAHCFRRFRSALPASYVRNMENAGTHVTRSTGHAIALLTLFFISPLSSAQLFEAAGIMRNVALRPLALAFAGGRSVSYSTYVFGSQALAATSVGELIRSNLTSPNAIAIQVAMVCALVGFGLIPWKPHVVPQDDRVDTP